MIIDARRACHWTLLRLAGRVPDGLLTESRRLLARGRYVEMARIVALAVAGRGIALHEDDDERDRILGYLDAGSPVLITIALLNDVIDPDRGRAVPMNFRTDGTWIWNDISAYCLRTYGFRPDPALVAHIEANGRTMPQVDGVAEFRAVALLYRSKEEGEDATAACRWR